MKTREFENALLLRDSGELNDGEIKELEAAIQNNPELSALAKENQVLQQAGPLSSAIVVPPLPEITRERILQSGRKSENRRLPRLLALAALFVLGLGLLPHLTRPLLTDPPVVTADVEPIRSDLQAEDPILNTLEDLETELAIWEGVAMDDPAFLENESDWAEILLSSEDAI